MKKTLLLSTLLILPILSFGQSQSKRKALSKKFVRKMHTHLIMDTIMWKEQAKVFNHIDEFFKSYNLDPNNADDYKYFTNNVQKQFTFARTHIYNQLLYKYKRYNYKELLKLLEQVNKGKRRKVMYSSGYYPELKALMSKEMNDIHKYTIPKYLEIIKRKHQPIPIEIVINNKKIKATDVDIDMFVNTGNVDYQKVPVLSKDTNEIMKPNGYTYDQIVNITVYYKGMEFVFTPDEKIYNLPKNLTEVNSFISKYSYQNIPKWKLRIYDNKEKVSVQLTNVVSAKIVKSKPKIINFNDKIDK
jgi:hypothetical protein